MAHLYVVFPTAEHQSALFHSN